MPTISKESHDKIVSQIKNKVAQREKLHEFQVNELVKQVMDLKAALHTVLNNTVKLPKAATAYHIAKNHPASESVRKDAEWYANIIKHLEP